VTTKIVQYIVSGSDEMCLRLWKARASEKLGVMKDRERVALQYAEKLKEKYAQHPKVRIDWASVAYRGEAVFQIRICVMESDIIN
jgi:hypothetical protein